MASYQLCRKMLSQGRTTTTGEATVDQDEDEVLIDQAIRSVQGSDGRRFAAPTTAAY
jgi:hypothetical protein